MQAKDFDGIKAQFNPIFEGPMGVGVQLTNDILDPASHSIKLNNSLRGRESYFKSTGNSRIPLVESMKAMVNLILSQMVNETGNEVQEEAASKLDGLGFQFSHRVEAIGGSGGIWIGWKNSTWVE
ncbi:hypothetical protein Goarm_013126, partial [Gossypium armourianum]|nr:hypothetical protein [Gossypium armourianum]